jgi:orsellinic acid C2-O-methyltransferase
VGTAATEDLSSDLMAERLLSMVSDCWRSQAIHAFAALGLAEALSAQPQDATSLASRVEVSQGALEQLLNASVSLGLVLKETDGKFHLTDLGTLLSEDSPHSIKNWTMWWGQALWPLWGSLTESVRTGESARKLLFGTTGFEHIQQDPVSAAIFNKGLAEVTRMAAKSILRAFDFSQFSHVMDVGGGHGQLLSMILQKVPDARGVLFDLPHAIDGAREHLARSGVSGRVECVAGDFFVFVPTGADGLILKSVIHDWKDEDAVRILESCRRALEPGAKLLLIERIMPSSLEATPAHQTIARGDLTMLIAHGARERSEEEYRGLIAKSGLVLEEIVPTDSGFSVLVMHSDPMFK